MDDDNLDTGSSQSPREYDFSSDLNISEVKDDPKNDAPAPSPNDPIFKSISEAVDKSLSEAIKKPGSAPTLKPDPFREPINKLDTAWPFATPETIAKHQDRQMNPPAAQPAQQQTPLSAPVRPPQAAVPINLPGASPVDEPIMPFRRPAPAPAQAPNPAVPPISPSATAFRPASPAPSIPRPAPVVPQPAANVPQTSSPAEHPLPGSGTHPGGLQALRTYEGDVAAVLASRPVSKASIAMAESKKRGEGETIRNADASPKKNAVVHTGSANEQSEQTHLGLKITLIIIALILIAGGAFGGYYLYMQSPLGTPAVPVQQPQIMTSIIPYDSRVAVNTDNSTSDEIIARINAQIKLAQPPETIKEILFTETKDGLTYRVTAPEMMLLAAVPVPDIIGRTLQPDWMFGVYSDAAGTTTPFAIVHTNLFQNAFAGMLSWEQSMPVDLKAFLGIPASTPTPQGSFKDRIVRNKDVRAFVTSDGSTLFEYSFVDDSTLVVAANDQALSLIISRLESKAFVR